MSWVEDWNTRAACRSTDPDELFVQGAAQNRAKAVCTGCPVQTECLADALDHGMEFGVWGGMTERERRSLLRRRPDVRSWRRFLEVARDRWEREAAAGATLTLPLERALAADRPVPVDRLLSGSVTGDQRAAYRPAEVVRGGAR